MSAPKPHPVSIVGLTLAALLTIASSAFAIGFLPPIPIPLGNSTNFAHAVKTADLNHDGLRDIVVVDWVSNVLDVILALPGGGFGPVVRIPSANAPYSVELVDLNGDAHLDAITGNRAGSSVSVFLGDGSGGFLPRTDFPVPAEVSIAAVGDMNGDGRFDVVAAADLRICLLAGDGAGHLAAPVSTILGGSLSDSQVWGLALGDLDQDGDLDVVTNYHGPLVELLNSGSGTFTRQDVGSSIGSRALAIADITGDGRADVIATSDFNDGIIVFSGDGSGGLVQGPVIPTGVSPWSLGVTDLDGDGDLDVVTPNIGSNTLSILLGAGGVLGAPTTLPTALNPISVEVVDMNGDGAPDIAETGYSGTVAVRFQIPSGGTGSSSVALAALPSPAVYGQDVTLTATVTPSSATGAVTFTEGENTLGVAAVQPGGAAHVVVDHLTGGFHTLRAAYSGDANLSPSLSASVQLGVTPAPTTTTLTTSPNPAAVGGTVLSTARVQTTPPSPMDGFVIFRLDGVLWRNVLVDPAAGTAATSTSELPLGHHTIVASYEGTVNHLSSLSATVDQVVVGPEPVIVSVRDVPNDQGGRVTLKWDSPADAPGSTLISGYRIWRRAPVDGAASLRAGGVSGRYVLLEPPGATQADYWEALAQLPAERLVHYAHTASTTQDSLPGSNPFTAFFVSALTADPNVFFHSQVDSGYSVDNLAPAAPAPFHAIYTAAGNDLHWTPVRTSDLREYRIHRGTRIDFTPGPENLFAVTQDSVLHDPTPGWFIYKLAAVDEHGNTSRFLVVTPDSPVGTLASLASLDALSDRVRLRWYSPGGAGTAASLYRRELTTDWALLARLSFDGSGYLVFEDRQVEPGRRYGYRLGLPNGDQETFTAEAWTEGLASPTLEMSLVSPNPSPTGRLVVAFSLPTATAAHLELVDVSGRRVAWRDLSSVGAGRHTVTLDDASGVRAGVYLLRLSQGSVSAMRRVVVLR
jgi:hypothetical protein